MSKEKGDKSEVLLYKHCLLSHNAIIIRMVGKITVGPPKEGYVSLVSRHKYVLSFVTSENACCIIVRVSTSL